MFEKNDYVILNRYKNLNALLYQSESEGRQWFSSVSPFSAIFPSARERAAIFSVSWPDTDKLLTFITGTDVELK